MEQKCSGLVGLFLACVVAVSLGGCGVQEGKAKDAVRGLLIDPDSAQFSGVRPGVKERDVCGFVNAKNRMGGFAGRSPFYYDGERDSATLVNPPKDSDFRHAWVMLTLGTPSTNEMIEVSLRCNDAVRWTQVCGEATEFEIYPTCLMDFGSRDFYDHMRKTYGRN